MKVRISWMSKAGGRMKDDLICPIENKRYRQINPNKIEEIFE